MKSMWCENCESSARKIEHLKSLLKYYVEACDVCEEIIIEEEKKNHVFECRGEPVE